VMGYGDIFIAGALGALLAAMLGRSPQLRGAALTALLAVAFDLLFFVVDELPATVPVATAMVVLLLSSRRSAARRDRALAERSTAAALAPGSRAPAVR
jgi:hypothetical protein